MEVTSGSSRLATCACGVIRCEEVAKALPSCDNPHGLRFRQVPAAPRSPAPAPPPSLTSGAAWSLRPFRPSYWLTGADPPLTRYLSRCLDCST